MRSIFITLVSLFISQQLFAQKPEVYSTTNGAIDGYDVVAYFTDAKPTKGLKEFSANYNNVVWFFSSASNQEKFNANPEKYAPQFGGYCAFGMSRGYKAETQPDAWTIVDGKLFMNYNLKVRTEWNKKRPEYIEKANENWATVKKQ